MPDPFMLKYIGTPEEALAKYQRGEISERQFSQYCFCNFMYDLPEFAFEVGKRAAKDAHEREMQLLKQVLETPRCDPQINGPEYCI